MADIATGLLHTVAHLLALSRTCYGCQHLEIPLLIILQHRAARMV